MVLLYTIFFAVFIETFGKLSFVILHMNDVHGKVAEISVRNSAQCPTRLRGTNACIGGMSRAATVIQKHREEEEQRLIQKVLFLNAGNDFTGSIWFREHKEKILSDFMNLLKPDALVIGSREFRYGEELLAKYLSLLTNIPIVSTNIDGSNFKLLHKFLKNHLVIDIFGVPVGIVGFVTPYVEEPSSISRIYDEIESLTNETIKLQNMGVSIIIAVGTSSWDIIERIAVEVPFVDIVIGGQCTYLQWNLERGPPPENLPIRSPYPQVIKKLRKNILLAVTPGDCKYIGRMNVTFDDNGVLMDYAAIPIFLDNSIPQEPKGLDIIKKYNDPILQKEGIVVAKSKVIFTGGHDCAFEDCNYGNMITDALVNWAGEDSRSPQYWTSCPIAVFPTGHISSYLDPTICENQIIESQIYDSLPFDDKVVTCSLAGVHLKQVFENSVVNEDMFSLQIGGFLQVSGAKFSFSMAQSIEARVSELRILCGNCWVPKYMDLELSAVYNIVTISRLLDGDFGHVALQRHTFNKVVHSETAISILIKYLKKISPAHPQHEDRIIDITAKDTSYANQLLKPHTIIKFALLLITTTFSFLS